MRPMVSIVTVVFNGAATLERTIQSVLAQRGPAMEYIIVDGGSTDGTLEIIKRYEDQLECWVSGPDTGIYDAMNKGIALCRGQWVGLINADDAYVEDALQLAMTAAASHTRVNIVHGDIMIEYPNGYAKLKKARNSSFLLKYWEMVLNHPSFFVRRSYYVGRPFDATFKVSGDHHWTLRAWMEDRKQFLYIPKPMVYYMAGGASMTHSLDRVLEEGDRLGRSLGLGAFERRIGKVVRTMLYLPSIAKLRFNEFVAPLLRR